MQIPNKRTYFFHRSNRSVQLSLVLQTSANQGPDSSFFFEANIKALMSKSNSSLVMKLMVQGRASRPRGEYQRESSHFWVIRRVITCVWYLFAFLKYSNIARVMSLTPNSAYYSTLNKGRISSYFWIAISGQVIRRSCSLEVCFKPASLF